MTDPKAGADNIRIVVQAHHGKVINCFGNVITIKVPAVASASLNALWQTSGLVAVLLGQTRHGARHTYSIDLDVDARR